MKFIILHRSLSPPPETDAPNDDFQSLVWPQCTRDFFEESYMQCLSLVRRQKGNVISMKLVLRNYEAE